MKVYVNYNDNRWHKYKIDFVKIANAAALAVAPEAEVSITLTNDEEIHKLNKQYRHIDKPTNVLSFELGDDILLGDIYISLDTVVKESKQENISVQDHTAHMIVHGMLHLQGYDHIKESDAVIMESKETKILEKMNIKNPYVDKSAVCSDFSCCPGSKILSFFKRIKIKQNGVSQYIFMALLGGMAALGFAPTHFWWLTVIGFACAYKLVIRDINRPSVFKAFLRVFPFSAVYAVAMFWWVVNSIYVVPELAEQFAIWTIPALLGIGLLGGIIFAIPFVVIMRICTFPPCRAILFASTWTFILWLREWFLTGFPWNPIANILMPYPILANSMALWGALGTTFVIMGIIAIIVELFGDYKNKYSWTVLVIFLLLGIAGGYYGYKNIKCSQNNENISQTIRIVQPARSAVQKASHSREEAIRNATENVRGLIDLAKNSGNPDLIVFPETSYPFVVMNNDDMPIAEALDNNIIIGATSYSEGRLYNSMLVAAPNGRIQKIYSKSHLVPFGEYRPFGDIIPTPGQLSKGAGAEIINVDINGRLFTFAPAICYEIIFSDSLIPDDEMPDAIINITNDTWFGDTPGTYQHLDMVRRYAIESGVPIVRANYSGVSAFIASDGTILSEIPVGTPGYMDGVVYGDHMTVYREIGRDGWMFIILLFACFGIIPIYMLQKRK